MNQLRNLMMTLLVTGGLAACSTPVPIDPEPEPPQPEIEQPIERPDIEQPIEREVEEPFEVEPEPEAELKPEPKPLPVKTADGKLILGAQEWVYFPSIDKHIKAGVDESIANSSVSAVDVTPFERDGKDWVKFKIKHQDLETKEFEAPVQRWLKVKQANGDDSQRRAVVVGWVQLGDLREQAEFTLVDNGQMAHPVQLGRNFFNDVAELDKSRTFVQGKATPQK
ncbi:ATP-dependent zinc protease family protein [Vibrio sp. WXL210]|uniref:ATP-dependent zinc protease family protein n=1 Tax=Vibrio sp. WXL210 TaxID=3450709 RepID=UPI003EC4D917